LNIIGIGIHFFYMRLHGFSLQRINLACHCNVHINHIEYSPLQLGDQGAEP